MQIEVIEHISIPVTVDEGARHLRLGSIANDQEEQMFVESKIAMAVAIAEDKTSRHISLKKVEVICEDVIDVVVPFGMKEVEIYVSNTLLSSDNYKIVNGCDRTYVSFNERQNDVKIKASVGYDRESLPGAIRAAILLLLGTLYDHESDNLIGRSVSQLSVTADSLLDKFRILPY